ncbi:hypothetical protein GCM10028820_19790 [Tessaracoccus terricola]
MLDSPAPSASTPDGLKSLNPELLDFASKVRADAERLLMEHQFAVEEVLTKVNILREEFKRLHRYNPIEHVGSRVKTMPSILEKVVRVGCEPTISCIREHIRDIAGIRITCSFIADTYQMLDALTSQDDVRVLEVEDYIKNPKPNGYKSLHAIVEIPVFLSTGPVLVNVEVQIRTIAMDFWASLEHKIFYKYKGDVPPHLVEDLRDAAATAADLDSRMERLHSEIHGAQHHDNTTGELDADTMLQISKLFLRSGEDAVG